MRARTKFKIYKNLQISNVHSAYELTSKLTSKNGPVHLDFPPGMGAILIAQKWPGNTSTGHL